MENKKRETLMNHINKRHINTSEHTLNEKNDL